MIDPTTDSSIFRAFAELLEYPQASLAPTAKVCASLLLPWSREASALVGEFAAAAERIGCGALQELYTRTFDLNATHCPYVGYQLFGESYKRSVFLVRLKTEYRACGIDTASEVPDHLALVLRFVAASEDTESRSDVIGDAVLPALGRMLRGAGGVASCDHDGPPSDSPGERSAYLDVLEALRVFLRAHGPTSVAAVPADDDTADDRRPSPICRC